MKKHILIIFCLIFSFPAFSQVKYTNPEKQFSVIFPSQPEYSTSDNSTESEKMILHNYMSIENENVVYMVSLVDFNNEAATTSETIQVLENSVTGFFGALETTPENRKEVKYKKITGLEYNGNNGTYLITYRVYIHNNLMYQVAVLGVNKAPIKKNKDKFFKSFKIL